MENGLVWEREEKISPSSSVRSAVSFQQRERERKKQIFVTLIVYLQPCGAYTVYSVISQYSRHENATQSYNNRENIPSEKTQEFIIHRLERRNSLFGNPSVHIRTWN